MPLMAYTVLATQSANGVLMALSGIQGDERRESEDRNPQQAVRFRNRLVTGRRCEASSKPFAISVNMPAPQHQARNGGNGKDAGEEKAVVVHDRGGVGCQRVRLLYLPKR